MFSLRNKIAIITGASQGIGRTTAELFSKSGAHVVCIARNEEKIKNLANIISKNGHSASYNSCDISDGDLFQNTIKSIINNYGKIDILVNNAAINPVYETIEKMSNEVYDKMFNVNVKAIFDLSNLCFPFLKKKKSGSIINIASVEGLKPSLGLGIYSITKAAVIMLTQVQAKEWGKHGIRSNAICPGLIKTKFSKALWENQALLNQVKNQLPAGRIAEPEEMIGLALYLASSAGSYSTGGIYTADGGHMTI